MPSSKRKTFRSSWTLVLFALTSIWAFTAVSGYALGEVQGGSLSDVIFKHVMIGGTGAVAAYAAIRSCFMRLEVDGDQVTYHGLWKNTSFRTTRVRPTTFSGGLYWYSWLPSFKRADNGEWEEFPMTAQYNFLGCRPPRSVRRICAFVNSNLAEIRQAEPPCSSARDVSGMPLASDQC